MSSSPASAASLKTLVTATQVSTSQALLDEGAGEAVGHVRVGAGAVREKGLAAHRTPSRSGGGRLDRVDARKGGGVAAGRDTPLLRNYAAYALESGRGSPISRAPPARLFSAGVCAAKIGTHRIRDPVMRVLWTAMPARSAASRCMPAWPRKHTKATSSKSCAATSRARRSARSGCRSHRRAGCGTNSRPHGEMGPRMSNGMRWTSSPSWRHWSRHLARISPASTAYSPRMQTCARKIGRAHV